MPSFEHLKKHYRTVTITVTDEDGKTVGTDHCWLHNDYNVQQLADHLASTEYDEAQLEDDDDYLEEHDDRAWFEERLRRA